MIKSVPVAVLLCAVLLTASCSGAGDEPSHYRSAYATEESRPIKSLSQDDIRQLEQGQGWGLAKAAELNGMPGPVHLLEMRQALSLSAEQAARVEAIYEDMRAKAVPLGARLIELERELDTSFASQDISDQQLRQQLESIAQVYKELRYVHLAAHLETPAVLSAKQIGAYNRLRGYDSSDPCAAVPHGHDAQMWRRHNNCD